MVNLDELRAKKGKPKPIHPVEIFRRLPKPININDLYSSQAEVLSAWFDRRSDRDVVVKLHTGGGKTLVGLLMAQSTLNETLEPVVYLAPTVQLVNQAMERAKECGIPVVSYTKRQPLNSDFVNAKAIMIATYSALFHGKSKFGLRGEPFPQSAGGIIVDDAHAAFSVIRDQFTIKIESAKRDLYETLTGSFRKAFKELDRVGTFDDVVSGAEYLVLEVPYWAWREKLDVTRRLLADAVSDQLPWPLLRDRLHLCQAFISRTGFTITPILPVLDQFPTFAEARRRIYMSATLADDSEIVRTFDADPEFIRDPLTSRSLAGVSERMILIPGLMRFRFDVRQAVEKLLTKASGRALEAVILAPSDSAAANWQGVANIAKGATDAEDLIQQLQQRSTSGPVVFANRYDGIDLPGDSCRLLVMDGLPRGTSDYEMFRAGALYGGSTITRMLAQRLEQGIGRGARGSGDHCVVILVGNDLVAWVSKSANFRFLTPATRAQVEIGIKVSKAVSNIDDLFQTIARSFDREPEWTQYHAETLVEMLDDTQPEPSRLEQAAAERKAVNLWRDGYPERAIAHVERFAADMSVDSQTRGWMQQLGGRIADAWGHRERAEDLQREAFANNRNLTRPKTRPHYSPLAVVGPQEQSIAQQIGGYRQRRGFLASFDETVANLHPAASSNQFEQALKDLGTMIGLSTERFSDGQGPDVLWLLPNRMGFVIEAKSHKKAKNALTKEQHGQLLVAVEWFKEMYPSHTPVRVSVHPKSTATKAAVAGASHALTFDKLETLVADARQLLTGLCESQLPTDDLVRECARALASSTVRATRLAETYLVPFKETE